MAERALERVEDQLKCSICLDIFTNPKLLQCLHVFCQTCLVKLVYRNERKKLVLSCPHCRQETRVPTNGVACLQPAFHINHLLDIAEDLKREREAPAREVGAGRVDNAPPQPQEGVSFCSEHGEERLKLYCETCGELICYQCALNTGKHHRHRYMLLEKSFERYRNDVVSSIEPIKKLVSSVEEVLAQFEKRNGEISDQRAAIEADIHTAINELHQVLDVRRTELIGCLHQLTQRKLKDLAAQRDHVETIHAQLKSCLEYMDSIDTERQSDALKVRMIVVKQVKELTTTVQPATLQPNTEVDIGFSASADITASCRQFGLVALPSGLPDPSKCKAIGKGLEIAEVRQKATAILQVFNSTGEPCNPAKALECKLVSDITDADVLGSIKKLSKPSQYEISYQPTIKGRHQLHITVEGQHIRGSPFRIAVASPVLEHSLMHCMFGIEKPWGIAINHKGEIVVSEKGRISVFSPSGKKIQTIHTSRFLFLSDGRSLCGLTCDGDGNIIAGEDKKHSIRKYSPEGQLLVSVGTEGTGQLQFQEPVDIAFNTTNNCVYVLDRGNHRVQVLNSDFTFSSAFGVEGLNEGQFQVPYAIACNSAGNVYVADSANHRVQVFTAEGKFLRTFGSHGEGRGELNWPIGVAIDPSNDRVYVSENLNQRVSVFTSEGQFVGSFYCDFFPHGLAVDSGVVYVCDGFNNCVRVF